MKRQRRRSKAELKFYLNTLQGRSGTESKQTFKNFLKKTDNTKLYNYIVLRGGTLGGVYLSLPSWEALPLIDRVRLFD